MRTVEEQIAALRALEDVLAQRPLNSMERDALILAVLKAITSKK